MLFWGYPTDLREWADDVIQWENEVEGIIISVNTKG